MSASRSWARVRAGALNSARVFVSDLGNGLMVVSHSSLAVIGLAVPHHHADQRGQGDQYKPPAVWHSGNTHRIIHP